MYMCKYPNLIGVGAHKFLQDGINVQRYYLVSIHNSYQSKGYVLYKSKITYIEYPSGFNTKFQLVKHYDYLDWIIYMFDERVYLNNLNEYFLIQENNIFYAYNFKLSKIKELNQDYVIKFLDENYK